MSQRSDKTEASGAQVWPNSVTAQRIEKRVKLAPPVDLAGPAWLPGDIRKAAATIAGRFKERTSAGRDEFLRQPDLSVGAWNDFLLYVARKGNEDRQFVIVEAIRRAKLERHQTVVLQLLQLESKVDWDSAPLWQLPDRESLAWFWGFSWEALAAEQWKLRHERLGSATSKQRRAAVCYEHYLSHGDPAKLARELDSARVAVQDLWNVSADGLQAWQDQLGRQLRERVLLDRFFPIHRYDTDLRAIGRHSRLGEAPWRKILKRLSGIRQELQLPTRFKRAVERRDKKNLIDP
jgi:hypothetical protein